MEDGYIFLFTGRERDGINAADLAPADLVPVWNSGCERSRQFSQSRARRHLLGMRLRVFLLRSFIRV